jgi:hypothetical protein
VLIPSTMVEGIAPLLAALRTSGWQDALRGFVSSAFLPTETASCYAVFSRTSIRCRST